MALEERFHWTTLYTFDSNFSLVNSCGLPCCAGSCSPITSVGLLSNVSNETRSMKSMVPSDHNSHTFLNPFFLAEIRRSIQEARFETRVSAVWTPTLICTKFIVHLLWFLWFPPSLICTKTIVQVQFNSEAGILANSRACVCDNKKRGSHRS